MKGLHNDLIRNSEPFLETFNSYKFFETVFQKIVC